MTLTFKANNPYNSFLLLVYGLLLKLPMFLVPVIPKEQQVDGFLYRAFLSWLHPFGSSLPIIYPLLAFVLLYSQAIIFNKLVSDLRLLQTPGYLTGMSYLLLSSLFSDWNILSAPLIINSLILWVWARMSSLHNAQNPKTTLFNIGLAIGICTFFYFPSLAFTALIIFGLLITRPFKLAEWLLALMGIICPYYFLLSYVFLADKWQGYHFPGFAITAPHIGESSWSYAAIIIVAFLALLGFIYVQKNFRRQLIQARKSWNLLFLYLLIALFVPFINATHSFQYWIISAIPLAALMGAAFYYPTVRWIPGFFHWLLVALVLAISFLVK